MEPVYELVFRNKVEYLTFEEVDEKYTVTDYSFTNPRQRKELHNTPQIQGFLGAMFGGFRDNGQLVLRYETQEAYDILSA